MTAFCIIDKICLMTNCYSETAVIPWAFKFHTKENAHCTCTVLVNEIIVSNSVYFST